MHLFNLFKSPTFQSFPMFSDFITNHFLYHRITAFTTGGSSTRSRCQGGSIFKLGENDGTTWRENWKMVLANSNYFRFLNFSISFVKTSFLQVFFFLTNCRWSKMQACIPPLVVNIRYEKRSINAVMLLFALSDARASVGYLDVMQ